MKKLKWIIVSLILFGCDKGVKHRPVVIFKSTKTYFGSNMEPCMCRFAYEEYSQYHSSQEFIDSCHKYNIGDTIIGKPR